MSDTANYTTRTICRICGSTVLTPVLSLGAQAVSDFVPADKVHAGNLVPIELDLCGDCSLVQARHTVPSDLLYTRRYWFRSGVTDTLRAALQDVADACQRRVNLRPGDVVLDIGANDGTGLRCFTAPGIVRVACEPAANLAEECRVGVDCLIREFWAYAHYATALYLDKRLNRWERLPKAKAITALGMAYDLEDPNSFVADIKRALAPDGLCVWQLMCLKQMIEKGDVGNLAHEHLEFYSLRSLAELFGRNGLQIFDVEENDTNGGSYRLFIQHDGPRPWVPTDRCYPAYKREDEMRLSDPEAYRLWSERLEANRRLVRDFLREERALGKRIWILGASTKGNVLAQWLGLDDGLIEAAAERSPEKVGLHMVGSGIPIRSEEDFRRANPDVAVIMPYAFQAEIVDRERDWMAAGGRFVVPLPVPRVLSLVGGELLEVPL